MIMVRCDVDLSVTVMLLLSDEFELNRHLQRERDSVLVVRCCFVLDRHDNENHDVFTS